MFEIKLNSSSSRIEFERKNWLKWLFGLVKISGRSHKEQLFQQTYLPWNVYPQSFEDLMYTFLQGHIKSKWFGNRA